MSGRARAGGEARPERSPRALAISIAAHTVVAVLLLQFLTFGHGFHLFDRASSKATREERVTFVEASPAPPRTAQRATSTSPSTVPAATSGPVLVAPAEVPQGVATVPARADTGSGAAPGKGIGAVDPNLRGVKPSYGDPRVWAGPEVVEVPHPGRTGAQRLDSVMAGAILAARDSLDSLARAQGKYGKAPGDWTTTDKDGRKWGWDNAGIRLGKVTIPNALLGLLPLNAQKGMSGNLTEMDRERRLSYARADIARMSDRSMGEAEFRKIADELRDRRERERRYRLRAPDASVAPSAKPSAKPGDRIPERASPPPP